MTDLEMTRLCAEAMAMNVRESYWAGVGAKVLETDEWMDGADHYRRYDPLHDDAQVMALVKKFKLQVLPNPAHGGWWIAVANKDANGNDDLNRAIVECVAKMRAEKSGIV